jgi:hypothetical protein
LRAGTRGLVHYGTPGNFRENTEELFGWQLNVE